MGRYGREAEVPCELEADVGGVGVVVVAEERAEHAEEARVALPLAEGPRGLAEVGPRDGERGEEGAARLAAPPAQRGP